jgi:hypothetical protein
VSRLIGEEEPARVVVLRNLPGVEFEFIRTTVPAGVEIGSFPAHAPGSREWVAVETGSLTVVLDGVAHTLAAGERST